MIHNINVYRSSGEPHNVRLFTFAADDACNLPDGCQILHTEALYDDHGEYIQLWVSVPESSELARQTRKIEVLDEDTSGASDQAGRLNEDYEADDDDDDDGAAFKL